MNRDQKAVAIAAIATHIDESEAIFAVDYRGITVAQVAELRTKLREADATFQVVKNSLTERAADQVGAAALKGYLAGPTALTFVRGDAALAAKAIADYAKATQLLPFKGGMMGGEELELEQIRSLSRLPSRQVLYGQLVGVVASPIGGLVRSLGGLLGGLAVALGQVREKKESGGIQAGEAPPAAEQPAADSAASGEGEPAVHAEAATPAGPDAPAPAGEAPGDAGTQAPTEEARAQAEPGADPGQSSDASAPGDDETEPDAEQPAQADDKQADVSAETESDDAETNPTKED